MNNTPSAPASTENAEGAAPRSGGRRILLTGVTGFLGTLDRLGTFLRQAADLDRAACRADATAFRWFRSARPRTR